MPFTVTKAGGTNKSDFEHYIRWLEKWGINIANTPRTPEPGTRKRWLPVWENEADAQRFAGELRAHTEDESWEVYPLQEACPPGPLGPLDIHIGRRSDGCAYGLHPHSSTIIRKRFPKARPVEAVFIATPMKDGLEAAQGAIWDQVVRILTGLSEQQLAELGGYRIYDPDSQKYLREPLVAC
jgi:hypothetical protein